jgi:hypothetical protein
MKRAVALLSIILITGCGTIKPKISQDEGQSVAYVRFEDPATSRTAVGVLYQNNKGYFHRYGEDDIVTSMSATAQGVTLNSHKTVEKDAVKTLGGYFMDAMKVIAGFVFGKVA